MTILDTFRLTNRIAVVTGGTGLYGTPFARALAEAGAHVVITSRKLDQATTAAEALSAEGLLASGYALDLADPESIAEFTAAVVDDLGGIDVLVNNAVHRQGTGLFDTTAADWDATSAVNSRGLFLLSQAVSTSMVEKGRGSIINIGSIYGIVGPDFGIYAGAGFTSPAFYAYDKGGMTSLTRYLACALGPHGIRVNCLAPGGMQESDHVSDFVAAYQSRVPLGRMARGEDPAGALVFLASDASSYITGVTLPVDGGWTAR